MTTSDTGSTPAVEAWSDDTLTGPAVAGRPDVRGPHVARPVATSAPPSAATTLLKHGFFVVLLVAGMIVRLVDSKSYAPGDMTSFVDHLLGLVAACGVYLLLVRWGVWRWLAAVATAPILLGTYVRASESRALPDLAVVVLAVAVVLVLGWKAPLTPVAVLLASGLAIVALVLVGRYSLLTSQPTGGPAGAGAWLAGSPGRWDVVVPLTACLLLAAAAVVGLGRAYGSGMSVVCLLTAATAAVMPAVAIAGGDLTRRHLLVAVALLPAAGALGLTALARGRRGRSAAWPQGDAVDRRAIEAFDDRYGDVDLAPVVIVIAAYNEADGIAGVIAELPATVGGLPADVIVVDDGSTDGTADVLRHVDRRHRVYVVVGETNRGQGAALRLGYRVAREHDARYVVTTDADGQYDPADMEQVLAPVLDGSADFVTGSRLLGGQETRDRVRRSGVHVFAWIVTVMTGQRTTDTSFGLRAMRAELTAAVTLNQPQYQASELLLGTFSHGFVVAEVPGRMRLRSAGVSKKGRNAVYGVRYTRVVFGTWWREGCPFPAPERAPATADTRRRR